MQLIQHFTVDVIVSSLHPTFHKDIQSESRFVSKGCSGSGVQDLLHSCSVLIDKINVVKWEKILSWTLLGVEYRICYTHTFTDKLNVKWEKILSWTLLGVEYRICYTHTFTDKLNVKWEKILSWTLLGVEYRICYTHTFTDKLNVKWEKILSWTLPIFLAKQTPCVRADVKLLSIWQVHKQENVYLCKKRNKQSAE